MEKRGSAGRAGLVLIGDGTNGSLCGCSGACGGKYPSWTCSTREGSPPSGASSTNAACGGDAVAAVSSWTSGSRGSSAGSSSSSLGLGFDSLGSFPSRMALRMRAAFHFANLIFWRTSGSGVPHSWVRSKKVAAASKVSAVCLEKKSESVVALSLCCAHLVTLFALIVLSARSNVSCANCST